MKQYSCVVLTHSRHQNLPRIVKRLLGYTWIDDIHVWNNGQRLEQEALEIDDEADRRRCGVVNCWENLYTWGRFVATQGCWHDWVLTQDDDYEVPNFREIRDLFEQDTGCIAAALAKGHYQNDARRHWDRAHEVLLGWGSVFDRRWIRTTLGRYRELYGADEIFYRKADRLFAILMNRPHAILESKAIELEGATTTGLALYTRPDHKKLTVEARRKALGILGIAHSESSILRT